jgi:hypothetical protein
LIKHTKEEEYCFKHGHSHVVYLAFRYVHCGNCHAQIGDTLTSVFPMDDKVNPYHENCPICAKNVKTLSKHDLTVLRKLRGKIKENPTCQLSN